MVDEESIPYLTQLWDSLSRSIQETPSFREGEFERAIENLERLSRKLEQLSQKKEENKFIPKRRRRNHLGSSSSSSSSSFDPLVAEKKTRQAISANQIQSVEELLAYYRKQREDNPFSMVPWLASKKSNLSREELNQELFKFCQAKETPILFQEIDQLSLDELKHLRRLGDTCFTLEELWNHIQTSQQRKKARAIQHPITGVDLEPEEIQSILDDYKSSFGSPPTKKQDVKQRGATFQIIEIFDPILNHIFYKIQMTGPKSTINMGYIPEFQSKKNLWTDTAVILSGLQELWDQGKLLGKITLEKKKQNSNKITLGKTANYWLTIPLLGDEGDGFGGQMVDEDKVELLAEQVRNALEE